MYLLVIKFDQQSYYFIIHYYILSAWLYIWIDRTFLIYFYWIIVRISVVVVSFISYSCQRTIKGKIKIWHTSISKIGFCPCGFYYNETNTYFFFIFHCDVGTYNKKGINSYFLDTQWGTSVPLLIVPGINSPVSIWVNRYLVINWSYTLENILYIEFIYLVSDQTYVPVSTRRENLVNHSCRVFRLYEIILCVMYTPKRRK